MVCVHKLLPTGLPGYKALQVSRIIPKTKFGKGRQLSGKTLCTVTVEVSQNKELSG